MHIIEREVISFYLRGYVSKNDFEYVTGWSGLDSNPIRSYFCRHAPGW